MYAEPQVTWSRRISRAVLVLIMNLALWVLIPSILFDALSGFAGSAALSPSTGFIYVYGAVITGLQVLGALTEGMMVSVPFNAGSYLASAAYIYEAVNGGVLSLSQSGVAFTLSFQPLLYLLVLPSLFGAIRAPLVYLLDEHESVRPVGLSV